MLILTRCEGERLVIGDNVVLEVLEIDRGRVRIGITAPREVRVAREEVLPDGHPAKRPE